MKKTIIIGMTMFTLLFFGCQKETPGPEKEAEAPPPETEVGEVIATGVQTVGLGKRCGKSINTFCEDGLECKIRPNLPNKTGKCVNPIVEKNLTCDSEVTGAPVCAVKEDIKRGYMNECEARRHGAEVLHDRFCVKDESTQGSCEARVLGIGGKGCEEIFIGYQFEDGKCVEKKVAGCDAEIPFETQKACEKKCME